MSKKSSFNMVWMDMEMTGLEPDHDVILEIATVVTDKNLNILEIGPCLAVHQSESRLKNMDKWNTDHHTASGLIERVRASKISTKKAEELTLQFIKPYGRPKSMPLCGNSIGQDRRFLYKYMPRLSDYLHFRSIDVTTIKELLRRWYPERSLGPKKKKVHLALSDIQESIDELKFYREHFFARFPSS